MEGSLSHYRHVQMMHDGHLQSFTALVVITVVKGLDIKQYRESIVLPRLGALLDGSKPVVPVSVGARGDGAGNRELSGLVTITIQWLHHGYNGYIICWHHSCDKVTHTAFIVVIFIPEDSL